MIINNIHRNIFIYKCIITDCRIIASSRSNNAVYDVKIKNNTREAYFYFARS